MNKQLVAQLPAFAAPNHRDTPWPLIRAGAIGILLMILAGAAWVAMAPLSSAVIGSGRVKVDMNRKTVQHQDGGLVAEILVRDGTRVQAGQTLIVLKDVRVEAGNELARTQLDAELAKAARLTAEQTGDASIAYPAELSDRAGKDVRVAELLQRETALYRVRRSALVSQLDLIEKQIKETQTEIKTRQAHLQASDEAIAYYKDELAANEPLVDKGFISKTRLLSLQRGAAEYNMRRAESDAEMAQAQQKVSELRLRAESLRSNFAKEASNELRQTTTNIFALRERLRPAEDAEERQRITAPIAGEVVDLRVHTIGAVIAPREAIMDIVPDNPDLLVEAQIRPEDIGSVRTGSDAEVRLTAFRQRITPTVTGKVSYVSADSLLDRATNMTYYVVQVRIPAETLKQAGDLKLQAGMPAEVFIQTGERTALQYLLDPLFGFMQHSMREQ